MYFSISSPPIYSASRPETVCEPAPISFPFFWSKPCKGMKMGCQFGTLPFEAMDAVSWRVLPQKHGAVGFFNYHCRTNCDIGSGCGVATNFIGFLNDNHLANGRMCASSLPSYCWHLDFWEKSKWKNNSLPVMRYLYANSSVGITYLPFFFSFAPSTNAFTWPCFVFCFVSKFSIIWISFCIFIFFSVASFESSKLCKVFRNVARASSWRFKANRHFAFLSWIL